MGRCPTPRQGEVLPAPPARLRRAKRRRGRTYRTYRTYRTAVDADGLPKTKAWRAKPATPLQAPGPDVCLAHTHGPSPASPSLAVEGLALWACTVSFVSFVIEKHSGSPACGSTPPASVPLCLLCVLCVLRNLRFHLRCALCVPSWFFVSLAVEGLALWACTVVAAQRSVSSPPRAAARAFTSVAPPNFQASKLPSLQLLDTLKKLLDQFIRLCYLMAVIE